MNLKHKIKMSMHDLQITFSFSLINASIDYLRYGQIAARRNATCDFDKTLISAAIFSQKCFETPAVIRVLFSNIARQHFIQKHLLNHFPPAPLHSVMLVYPARAVCPRAV